MNSRILGQEKTESDLIAEKLVRRIVVKKGGLFLAGEGGGPIEMLAQGDKGDKGDPGHTPVKGKDYFDGKDGKRGLKGEKGDIPRHEIEDYKIRFENPDGTWGDWLDLTPIPGRDGQDGYDGEQGEIGPKGDIPRHEWNGTKIRFQNPDGTWGQERDLLGPQGQSIRGEDGKDGRSVKGDRGERGPQGVAGVAPWEIVHIANDILLIKAKLDEICKKVGIDNK
jgi:hypothetical protein